MKSNKLPVLALLAVGAMTSAQASEPAGSTYLTPMFHAVWADRGRGVDDDISFSLALGRAFNERWNGELNLSTADFDGAAGNDLSLHTAGLNVLRVFYRDARISPFLLLGAGWMENDRKLTANKGDWYADTGAGLLIKLGRSSDDTRGLSLRLDLRGRHDFSPNDDQFVDYMAGLGLQFAFGAAPRAAEPVAVVAPPPPPADTDGDGVMDERDRCPGTPAGARVDAFGCELDSDGDGVVDSRDKCPGTAAGAPVDAVGCELDSDGDGVLDSKDQCPGTAKGARVDTVGCEIKNEIRLPGVTFETDSDQLKPESNAILDNAVATLKRYPELRIEVAGHTDSRGSDAHNLNLSKRRAETVRRYLSDHGVDNSLSARGYGETLPIGDNGSDAGREQNRRVVLRILTQ